MTARFKLNLDLTGVIVLLTAGVLLPVMLLTAVGIVALVIAKDAGGIVTGVLVVSFAVTAASSALITVFLAGRKSRLARRQADFFAAVSHEIRTPLSAIRLYTQTLQSGKLSDNPAETSQCLATILRETEWLDALLERILAWRASTRDLLPLTLRTGTLADAIETAAQRFRTMTVSDTMQFDVAIDTRALVAHDAQALQGVVLNLLTNAYKYTGALKHIALKARDEGAHVIIEVRDNGIGMTPAETKRIFQPFYRAPDPTKQAPAGIGLGLAVARHLITRHGGDMTVISRKHEGSRFVVRLPIQTATP